MRRWSLTTLAFIVIFLFVSEQTVYAFGDTILKRGSRGGDVYELQGRLKHLGYYDGKIDGVFGAKTQNAVTWFQWKFGLKSDARVGPKTKLALWKATKNWRPSTSKPDRPVKSSHGYSDKDINLLARAVHSEARGEPYVGQVAIAAVILNRVEHEEFPNTVSGVIFEPLAFTAVSDGQFWLEPGNTARKAVLDAINGWDPSEGAIYYFNPATATSSWIWQRPQIKRIGKHIFCR